MKQKFRQNNGQVLLNFTDQADGEKKFALYRWDQQQPMSEEVAKVSLGKRSHQEREGGVDQLEHVRNYCFSQQPNDAKDEFVLHLDPKTNEALFTAVSTKLAIVKKKAMKLTAEEE